MFPALIHPDPLFTLEMYSVFVEMSKIEDSLKRLNALKQLVHELPGNFTSGINFYKTFVFCNSVFPYFCKAGYFPVLWKYENFHVNMGKFHLNTGKYPVFKKKSTRVQFIVFRISVKMEDFPVFMEIREYECFIKLMLGCMQL